MQFHEAELSQNHILNYVLVSSAAGGCATPTDPCVIEAAPGGVQFYGWVNRDNHQVIYYETASLTVTHVTVVNTVLHTTSVITKFPSGYAAPATNAGGTRVQTVTYTRSSKALTTVL